MSLQYSHLTMPQLNPIPISSASVHPIPRRRHQRSEAMTMHNPIIGGFNPDPSVCVVGDDIYLVNSTFAYFPGVPIYHSRDLVHWRQIGNILDRPGQLPLDGASFSGGIYAPTLRHHGGRFWMVTTNSGKRGNFLVHAERPEGPWSDPVWIDVGTFDPDLCWDENGTCWYCRSDEGERIVQAPIDPYTGKLLAPLRTIWENAGFFGIEGPHLYHIGDWWYLLVAGGGGCHTARGHLVAMARGRSPDGPFEPCPFNPVLSMRDRMFDVIQATGHADLFQTADGRWWMVFLGWRNYGGLGREQHPLGRETFLSPVEWRDGWPVPGVPELEMPDPGFAPCPWPTRPERDDFDEPALGYGWLFLRSTGCASLSERPGWLRVRGDASTVDDSNAKGFVGRRVEHPWSRSTSLIDVRPGEGEAGLMLFLDQGWHAELGVRQRKGIREAFVRRSADDWRETAEFTVLAEGEIEVEVLTNPWACLFTLRMGGKPVFSRKFQSQFLSTSMAGGSTGLVVGLYATRAELDADWFEHKAWRTQDESGPAF